MNQKVIYLDYAAATPVDSRVLSAMLPYFSEKFYNPSAAYLPAKHLRGESELERGLLANLQISLLPAVPPNLSILLLQF